VHMVNRSDEVKIWDLLTGGMSLAEVGQCYGKNEPIIAVVHWTLCILSMCSFLNSDLLGTTDLQYQGSTECLF
jgi:hypothetical protein